MTSIVKVKFSPTFAWYGETVIDNLGLGVIVPVAVHVGVGGVPVVVAVLVGVEVGGVPVAVGVEVAGVPVVVGVLVDVIVVVGVTVLLRVSSYE